MVSQKDIDFDRMITHGRLAKLHQAEGNEEKASEHVAKAISFADGIGLQIKDKDGVMERVESTDRHDESDQRRHKSRVSM